MAKTKKKTSKSKKSGNRGLYIRLLALAAMIVSGYYFWGEVTAIESGGAGWWTASLIESVVFLYGLYVFVTGKVDLSKFVSGV